MYNRLKKIYKDSLVKATIPHDFDHYEWFLSPSDDYLGIEKKALEKKDIRLLEAFLQKVEPEQFTLTPREKWWHEYLFSQTDGHIETPYQAYDTCRFIHFRFTEPFSQKNVWKEAITAFFDEDIELIWESPTSCVVIELSRSYPKSEEFQAFSDIVDITASDFYSTVKLYIGSTVAINEKTKELYNWESKCFSLSMKARKKSNIHTFEQAIPYLVTGQLEKELVSKIKELFGSDLKGEQELIQNVKIYIENNLNVSLTAKKLFMHRNSLQYRIDKFSERTGIDIKNFQGALAAYLAIIILETER
ncbi:PucR family transcriptional regulator [Sutcliffiella deserti]|uniref:PucR family transcriptional regulator n=1 Tax=Sutcliffiella deserti TaxID=2875501 RepID=UPI001CBD6271|nr:helix-turn-helix domain-containing protein [Sutcliffiella deserti]